MSTGATLAAVVALAVLAGSAAEPRGSSLSDYPSCGSYWNRNAPVSIREQGVNRCIARADTRRSPRSGGRRTHDHRG